MRFDSRGRLLCRNGLTLRQTKVKPVQTIVISVVKIEEPSPKKFDRWSVVDWEKQDIEIARLLNCTREAVRQMRLRKNLNGIAVKNKHCWTKLNWNDIDWSKTDSTIAREIHCVEQTVRRARQRFNIPESPNKRQRQKVDKYPWSSVDWNLQDVVLARMLGCTKGAVGHARRKYNIPASSQKWHKPSKE